MHKVYIQTNSKQVLGALVSRYTIEKHLQPSSNISTEILNVEEERALRDFVGTKYLHSGVMRTYSFDDLQSFTLTRFMPPKLMGYQGRAVVIDPDVFALSDISPLFELDLGKYRIAACRKKEAWDTSVMLLECSKLQDWDIDSILDQLKNRSADHNDFMTLRKENGALELSREWNSLDDITQNTKLLHTTNRITQPWKTGLPIDFTRNRMPKFFGIIPREPIHKLLGKLPDSYLPHPNEKIEGFFFSTISEMLKKGEIDRACIDDQIQAGNVRKDFYAAVEKAAR